LDFDTLPALALARACAAVGLDFMPLTTFFNFLFFAPSLKPIETPFSASLVNCLLSECYGYVVLRMYVLLLHP